jgi:hypothetical protein
VTVLDVKDIHAANDVAGAAMGVIFVTCVTAVWTFFAVW